MAHEKIGKFKLPLSIMIFHGKLLNCQRVNPILSQYIYIQIISPYPHDILSMFKYHYNIYSQYQHHSAVASPSVPGPGGASDQWTCADVTGGCFPVIC
jgi:hypothetical protein